VPHVRQSLSILSQPLSDPVHTQPMSLLAEMGILVEISTGWLLLGAPLCRDSGSPLSAWETECDIEDTVPREMWTQQHAPGVTRVPRILPFILHDQA
jgi:hypothetical protein